MALAKMGVVAVGPNLPFGSGGSGMFVPEIVNYSQTSLLIPHLRQTIKTVLTEIVEVPDTIFAMPVDSAGLLRLPLLALIGRTPRQGEAATNDTTQILPVDFVYVQANVVSGVPDVQAYERDRLMLLQRALVADYRQGGAANATRIVNTALDHLTEYQKLFADDAQPVTAMVMTAEFDVIDARTL